MVKSKEFEFYVKTDLSKYGGKYVAIVENNVVSSGDNAKKVWEEAKKKFPSKKPLLAKIPREETLILKLQWRQNLILKKKIVEFLDLY